MIPVPGLVVAQVAPGSLAEELELEPGDKIVKINGQEIIDLVDFHFLSSEDYLEVEVIKADGECWQLEIDKEPDEEFGVQFVAVAVDGIKHCRNKCMFCFVDQTPPNMRQSLYEKDDDYRLSLTQGSFVTLSNLSDAELQRIVSLHLSPLYISVHATDPEVRSRLLKNPHAGRIMQQLTALAEAGIIMHTQIVLCPGLNDGEILERSIRELRSLWPQVQSMAVVPVGLTAYREGLADLATFNPQSARRVVELGAKYQMQFRQELGVNFLYFSDEFYVEAGLDFPVAESYDEFSQLENGVGLSRLFLDEVEVALSNAPKQIAKRSVHLVTGVSAGKTITDLVAKLSRTISGLTVQVHILTNQFFGSSVTVAGLLTGSDLVQGLKGLAGEEIFIPRVMLKSGEDVFLDDMTLAQVSTALEAKLTVVELDGYDFLEKLINQVQI
jgi:putative radical SAM enzyme (TIGR03279 family)